VLVVEDNHTLAFLLNDMGHTYRACAKEVGCELYLVKPVDTKTLENLLG
jgi:hypothetical protein